MESMVQHFLATRPAKERKPILKRRTAGLGQNIDRWVKVQEIKTCHILYVSESEGPRLGRMLRALKERRVLIESEIENSVMRGVMIEMRTVNSKFHLAINLEPAKAAHLTLSWKLMRLGEIVEPLKK
jgi:hypothetical protein